MTIGQKTFFVVVMCIAAFIVALSGNIIMGVIGLGVAFLVPVLVKTQ
jgi:hypothetical protein